MCESIEYYSYENRVNLKGEAYLEFLWLNTYICTGVIVRFLNHLLPGDSFLILHGSAVGLLDRALTVPTKGHLSLVRVFTHTQGLYLFRR